MILDNYLVVSDAQAVTVTAASTSHIDSLAAGDAVAPGARLKVQVNTAFVTGDGATLTVALQCDSDSAFGSVKTLFTTSALAVTAIDAVGDIVVDIQIPMGCERYIRVYYTVGTGSFSAGKIDARIVLDTDKTMDKQL
jgi:hypothetical protein